MTATKPLIGTVAQNVLAHGTGALNIDGCRIETNGNGDYDHFKNAHTIGPHSGFEGKSFAMPARSMTAPNDRGRWPANITHDGSDEVLAEFLKAGNRPGLSGGGAKDNRKNGHETIPDFNRKPSAPFIRGDNGSAARFFYCSKASRRDRNEGLDGIAPTIVPVGPSGHTKNKTAKNGQLCRLPRSNAHPTVKPTPLMRWLCRLITPPNGLILDPFLGSGSTGKAAILEGFRFIGIERESDYLAIARARIKHVLPKPKRRKARAKA